MFSRARSERLEEHPLRGAPRSEMYQSSWEARAPRRQLAIEPYPVVEKTLEPLDSARLFDRILNIRICSTSKSSSPRSAYFAGENTDPKTEQEGNKRLSNG
jgi:hypothetical protein